MRNEIDYLGTAYTDDDLAQGQGNVQKEESLNMERLAVNTFSVQIDSDTDLTGFSQNSPVVFKHRGTQLVTAYLQSVDRVGVTRYTLAAVSSLGRLTQRRHYGGIYTGQTAQAVITDICGTIPVYIDPVFRNIALYGWLPIDWARDNLARVLFAISANMRTDENGVIRIINLPTAVQSIITADNVYAEGASARVDAPVTSVTVLEHQYIPLTGTEPDTLFEGVTVAGQRIEFGSPYFDLVADGFTITERGANYAIVGAGNGTLTGKAYTHVTRAITRAVTTAPIPNEERYEDCGLVGLTNSATVADRLAEYHRHREIINLDAITTFEQPGDVVSLYHPYKRQQVNACIFDSLTILSGVLKSSIAALVGFTPWQTVEFEDVREVLTGSGTWTVPAGVTAVTAVLIGGGRGGHPGNAGEAAPSPSVRSESSWTTPYTAYYQVVREAEPGAGGLGGTGGDGGRILRVDLSVTPGQQIAYNCGSGSVGAEYGTDAQGAEGGATTFGSNSSANGSPSETGYTDPVTGELFAARGDTGMAGGHGAAKDNLPDPIVVNGVSYVHGAEAAAVSGEKGAYNSGYGVRGYNILGGMGGGPAYGANGGDGFSGTAAINTASVSGYLGTGGTGATALPPPAASIYGKGGTGGNGGGGGGAINVPSYLYNNVSNTSGQASRATLTLGNRGNGQGGDGSSGGTAAPGCTILTYRRPVTT